MTLSLKHYLGLIALCLCLYVPGIASISPTDRDEARFVQASKQMMETGDYVAIRYQDEARNKKPVGIYWLQTLSVKLTGAPLDEIWGYRLPSLIAATASVLLTAAIGSLLFDGTVGLLAALLLACSLLLNVEARIAKTDATLLMTVLTANYAVLRVWLSQRKDKVMAAIFWVAMAVGILVKGPIILVPVLPVIIAACSRDKSAQLWKNLCPLWGVPLMLLIIAPWLIAISIKTGGVFWMESVGKDLLGKAVKSQERGFLPPGYHAIAFFITFWPGCILTFFALPFIWKERKQEKIIILLAWVLATWLLFELVPTKLPHYTLPAFPAVALLTAAAWQYGLVAFKRNWIAISGWVVWGILSTVIIIGLALAPTFTDGTLALWQLLASSLCIGALLWWAVRGESLPVLKRFIILTGIAGAFYIPLFGVTLPDFRYIWVAQQVKQSLAATGCAAPKLISAAYNEPSLVFLNGTKTQLNSSGANAALFLSEGKAQNDFCRFALVTRKQWGAFITTADQMETSIERMADINGFSLGGGDRIEAQLVRVATTKVFE